MADWCRPAILRGAVSVCVLASGGTAWGQEAPTTGAAGNGSAAGTGATSSLTPGTGTTGTGTAGNGSAGTGIANPSPGSNGPMLATPGVLQQTGFGPSGPDIRLGNLGSRFGSSSAAAPLQPGSGRVWTLTPSLSASEQYITGGQGSGSTTRSNQFVTTVQPGIAGTVETVRLQGQLFYAPQVFVYSRDGRDDQVAQNVNGRLLATLVPQTLFLDLRGSGSEQANTPGQSPYGATTQANSNLSQTYSFSVAPYAVHRFGDWGTGEVGATYARTLQTALNGAGAAEMSALAATSNQNVTDTAGHLAFVTGNAFARYNGAAQAQASRLEGAGVLQGAYRNTVTLDNGYALTRAITALATIGWENIHYSGATPITIDDAVWNVGVRLVPNADSNITLRYGHQDGATSFFLNSTYQATARIRVYASYSQGLTTSAEQLQNALASSDLDALGNPVDHSTGAPLVPVGNFFGLTNSLFKTTLATFTVVWVRDRDSVSGAVNSQTQTLVSASNEPGLQSGNSKGVYGTLSWSHELRPDLRSTAYLEYGTQSGSGSVGSNEKLLTASARLSYALGPTVSGSLQYIYNQTTGQNPLLTSINTGSGGQSVFLASLTKAF